MLADDHLAMHDGIFCMLPPSGYTGLSFTPISPQGSRMLQLQAGRHVPQVRRLRPRRHPLGASHTDTALGRHERVPGVSGMGGEGGVGACHADSALDRHERVPGVKGAGGVGASSPSRHGPGRA